MTSQTGQMHKVPDFYLQSITTILPSVLLCHTNPKGLVLLIHGASAPGGGLSCWHEGRTWTCNAWSLDHFSLCPRYHLIPFPLTPSTGAFSVCISFGLACTEHLSRALGMDSSVFKVSPVTPLLTIFMSLLNLKCLLGPSSFETRELSDYRSIQQSIRLP